MQEGLKEEFEELKNKVRSKIVVAAQKLADAENDFRSFQQKQEAIGMLGLEKTVNYYVDALKFDSLKAIAGLDEEI